MQYTQFAFTFALYVLCYITVCINGKHKLDFTRSLELPVSYQASCLPHHATHNPTHSHQITYSLHLCTVIGKLYMRTPVCEVLLLLCASDDTKSVFCYLLFSDMVSDMVSYNLNLCLARF